jgi:hypothetical protein
MHRTAGIDRFVLSVLVSKFYQKSDLRMYSTEVGSPGRSFQSTLNLALSLEHATQIEDYIPSGFL